MLIQWYKTAYLPSFESLMSVRTRRGNPERNMARFYEIDVQPTLFGDYTVEHHWGRIGATDQSKTFWFDDEAAADKMASQVWAAKTRQGYTTPAPSPTNVNLC